jgi:hypothetical protein
MAPSKPRTSTVPVEMAASSWALSPSLSSVGKWSATIDS